jgi:uncharacterized protein (DUF305 family)
LVWQAFDLLQNTEREIVNIKKLSVYRNVFGFVLILALFFGFAAAASAEGRVNDPAPDRAAAKFEIDFMKDMIDHHAMAVMTATMCIEKAIHEELRAMCQNILTTQQQEIAEMQVWLSDWYGISYSPQMNPGMMRQMEKLGELAGAEFEIAVMEMMIKHQLGAIREASKCVERLYHEELRTLCENYHHDAGCRDRTNARRLCQWFGICR